MGDSYETVRVAAVQAAPVWLDREASTDKAISLIGEAASGGARLVAFGEAWLPGYPWWIWLDSPAAGVPYFLELYANAVEVPSPTTDALCAAARKHGIALVLGMNERDGGSLYCTQLVIAPDGTIAAARRKLKPTHVERTVWGEGDGSDLVVVGLPFAKVGALSCWEHLQPLSRFALFGLGEQIHVGSWPSFCLYTTLAPALGAVANQAASRSYALEGQAFVLHVCGVVDERVLDRVVDTDAKRALLGPGGGYTEIIGPDGSTLAGPLQQQEEAILYADLDLGSIPLAKMAADPAGHYARADATRLVLSRRPRRPIEILEQPPAFAENGSTRTFEGEPLDDAVGARP